MKCCDPQEKRTQEKNTQNKESCHSQKNHDYVFIVVLILSVASYGFHLVNLYFNKSTGTWGHLSQVFFELFNTMFWGIALGVVFVGLLGRVPREYIISVLGRSGTLKGLFRATLAGLLLDLCSHGILLVGMKLYERGASLGQTMAFLIASPWNSFSLTLILFSLIGFGWTLAFILLSGVIAILSGLLFEAFEKKGVLPKNPHKTTIESDFNLLSQIKKDFKKNDLSIKEGFKILWEGLLDSKMIIKWVLFGAILSSVINVFVDQGIFAQYFGPTLLGLVATLGVTTVLEVCSEGATPLAADLMNRAKAPGNSFTFLMAGVSTDYTEILSLRETTKSWKIAFFLPLITVPQVIVVGFILNQMS